MALDLDRALDSFVTFPFPFKFLESSFILMWKDWQIIDYKKNLYVNIVWLFSVCCVGCGRYHRIDQHRQWHDSPLQQPDPHAPQHVCRGVYEGLPTRVSGICGWPSHPYQGQGESVADLHTLIKVKVSVATLHTLTKVKVSLWLTFTPLPRSRWVCGRPSHPYQGQGESDL